MSVYVERDCVFEHVLVGLADGGAVVTPEVIVAYPAVDGVLSDWHGVRLGSWRAVSSWLVRSYVGERMFQIEARVDGVLYTGRGFGVGCIYRGRRKAVQS